MKPKFIKSILLLILISLFCKGTAHAGEGCFELGIIPKECFGTHDIQLLDKDDDVVGLRVDICCGHNQNVYGLDLGIINSAEKSVAGLQIGVLNYDTKAYGLGLGLVNITTQTTGLQFGIYNYSSSPNYWHEGISFVGIQIGAVNTIEASYEANLKDVKGKDKLVGLQIGVLGNNIAPSTDVTGLQISGLCNLGAREVKGVQIAGILNKAKNVKGVQIGLVNWCEQMTGVQIGVVNVIKQGAAVPVLPIINASW